MRWWVLMAVATAAADPRVAWSWPTTGTISSTFGMREGRPHEGVDIAAPKGQAVLASRVGRVIQAGRRGNYGLCVEIDHGRGWTTRYAHLSSITVRKGRVVRAGQRIGRVGSTGHSTGPHVHFEIRYRGRALDPARLIRR